MKIKIFTTGGTIDKLYFDARSEYTVGQQQITTILEQSNVHAPVEVEQLFQKDSLDFTDEDRAFIVEKTRNDTCSHILITHGTDTMVETARTLESIPNKTIVLVGALSPARFKGTDAEFNIGFALGALQALSPGVYIAMNGRIFPSDNVQKNGIEGRFEPLD